MKIPLAQPDITNKERKAVLDVLKTNTLALGPKLKDFESRFIEYAGSKYAVAVNSGTSGLHLIIRALGINDGDEVITTPFSFIASSNCILYERAKPVFVDIDRETLNIDPDKIEKAITPKTKAILAVDVFGRPAEWGKILKIAKKYKLKVVEDSCEALGAKYKSKKCGIFGDAAIFAFYPNKQITTGEGGMIVTKNKKIADLCRSMMNQGRKTQNGKWLEHVRLGFNYRMSDINAALGIVQLDRIDEILKKRENVAMMYDEALKDISEIILPQRGSYSKISWFVYVVQLNNKYSRKDRDKIMKKMQAEGVQCSNYFQCIHLQPLYKEMFGYKQGDFPIAEEVSDRTIALPFYGNLSGKKIKFITSVFKKCL